MRRERWESIDGLEPNQAPETKKLKWLAVAAVVLLVLAIVFAAWAVFIYQPGGSVAPTPTKTPRLATVTSAAVQPSATLPPPAATTAPAATTMSAPTATPVPPTATAVPTDTPAPTATSAPTATPKPTKASATRLNSPEYGMQVFGWWRPEVSDRDMGYVRDAGFTWIKQIFAWYDVEGAAKGHYDWTRTDRIVAQAEQYGLKILVRVDSAPEWAKGGSGPMRDFNDYGDFLYVLASRYKGLVDGYQIWNEPNLSREWGDQQPDPAAYARMLKVAYTRIKQADPGALIVSAGLAPTTRDDAVAMPDEKFVRGMYAAGAKPYFDLLGVHGAGYKAPPEADPGDVARDAALTNNDPSPESMKRIYCFRHVEDLRKIMVEAGDSDKQVVVLEFGWTVDNRPGSPYLWHAVSEQEQADYLVRAYQWAKAHWQPWIGLMSLIYIANPDWTENDEQYWWSITLPSWPVPQVRPAYERLKAMAK
jgi:hypothetical protein